MVAMQQNAFSLDRRTLLSYRALGSLIATPSEPLNQHSLASRAFDFYDHWSEPDTRMAPHGPHLSRWSEALAKDLNNFASYAHDLIQWVQPSRILDPHGVVAAGALTEAALVSIRSAADAIAALLGYVASEKQGQAPQSSLHQLLIWAQKHPTRVPEEVRRTLARDWTWLDRTRSLRDSLVHEGVTATIHTDRKQFNLWMHSPTRGWITREPLFPLLAGLLESLLDAAEAAGRVVHLQLGFPEDRIGSRVLNGIRVPALYDIRRLAPLYARPSP